MAVAIVILIFSCLSFGNVISFTGNLNDSNSFALHQFLVPANGSNITIQSWSFGGGINAASDVIPGGGFLLDISLFDSAGTLLADTNFTYACPPANLDSYGVCGDTLLSLSNVGAGQYTIGIVAAPNFPVGPSLADGFCATTNPGSGCDGSFVGNQGEPRNQFYAVDVTVDSPANVPEPASMTLVIAGLLIRRLVRPLR